MKAIKIQSNNIIVVEVPEDAKDISKMDECSISYRHNFDYEDNAEFSSKDVLHYQDVVKGKTFKILGKLSELKDKDLERFVEKFTMDRHEEETIEFENYINKIDTCKTVKQSFISLLQSNGIDTDKNLLIIEVL